MKSKRIIPLVMVFTTIVLAMASIDFNNLYNYVNQPKPSYILKDNTPGTNPITDAKATLGRVLFYDKQLSANGTIACASCHKQEFAFSDTAKLSLGLSGGLTGRHSMHLINSRFSVEAKFFWDERATSLENQTTRPIQDHIEMGFSGTNGDPDFDSLITRLTVIPYYQQLFDFAFGSPQINETKIQQALAQFIRSIQSFDSKYDVGRAQVANDAAPFPNFTADENAGKQLFLAPPPQGGAGCRGCHRAPEFDIDPNTRNNGVIGVAGSTTDIDITNTRAPSLRDLFNPSGVLNGPMMHNGNFNTIEQVINHYNLVPNNPNNTNLDPRLAGPGGNLQLTVLERNQLAAFLKTLSGNDVYTNPKWSNPFDSNGNLTIVLLNSSVKTLFNPQQQFAVYPNPASNVVQFNLPQGQYKLTIYDLKGSLVLSERIDNSSILDITNMKPGVYLVLCTHVQTGKNHLQKWCKQ